MTDGESDTMCATPKHGRVRHTTNLATIVSTILLKRMSTKVNLSCTRVQDSRCTYNVTMRHVRTTVVVVGKQWELHILSMCLCQPWVSSMQCAYAILSSVARPALLCFSTLSHKQHDFRKKKVLKKNICFDFICNSWRMKDQLDVTCYFISLIMCSTCFGH